MTIVTGAQGQAGGSCHWLRVLELEGGCRGPGEGEAGVGTWSLAWKQLSGHGTESSLGMGRGAHRPCAQG